MALLKVGIGTSLLRIKLNRVFSVIIIMTIILSLIVNLTVFGGTFGACQPIEKIWNKDPKIPGKCWDPKFPLAFSYIQTGSHQSTRNPSDAVANGCGIVGNIVTDLIFAFGPLVYLSKVKVSRYNKWALRGVFLIGLT